MYKILPLLGDVGLGVLSVIFVSILYNINNPYLFIFVPLILLPDCDAIMEIKRRGKVAASAENPYDHRELLHKPLLWLLFCGIAWYFTGHYGAIMFIMVLLHFIHDSVFTGWGVAWLSPFSNVRIKFFVDKRNEVSFRPRDFVRIWQPNELETMIATYGNENWIEDIYLTINIITLVEYGIFSISLTLFFLNIVNF